MLDAARQYLFGKKEEEDDDDPCPDVNSYPFPVYKNVYRDSTTNRGRFLKKSIRDRIARPGLVMNHADDTPLKIKINPRRSREQTQDYGCGISEDGVLRDCVYHMKDKKGRRYTLCCPPWKKGGKRTHYKDCKMSDGHGEDAGLDITGRAWLAKRKAFGQSTMGYEAGTPTDVWLTKINKDIRHRSQYLKENETVAEKQHAWKRKKDPTGGGTQRWPFWEGFLGRLRGGGGDEAKEDRRFDEWGEFGYFRTKRAAAGSIGTEYAIGEMPDGGVVQYGGQRYRILHFINGTGRMKVKRLADGVQTDIDASDNGLYLGANPAPP